MEQVFKRKIYQQLLEWKQTANGSTAILVEGARRVGKSTIVELFARQEYESYILIDFNEADQEILDLWNNLMNLDRIFVKLQQHYNVTLHTRKSVIIFDEVQNCPRARQAIKYLVKDGRYDYIETGSLISIKRTPKRLLFRVRKIVLRCCQWTMKSSVGHWGYSNHSVTETTV